MPIEIVGFNYRSITHCHDCGWEEIFDTEEEAVMEAVAHEDLCLAKNG